MTDDRAIGILLKQAALQLAKGDARAAEEPLRKVLASASRQPDALFMLGAALAMRGEHGPALAQYDAAISAKPGHVQAMAQKARSLDALDRREEAVAAADAVGRLPADPWSLDTAGVVMTRAGLHARAAEFYGRAAQVGGAPGYRYNLGSALVYLGKLDEARAAFRQCLARDPNHGPAWAGLVQITKQTREHNEIPRLIAIARQMSGDVQAVYTLGHAIAKAHEDLGELALAMEWLARAKAGMRERMDPAGDAAVFAAAEQSLGAGEQGRAAGAPVFVVGLPRSGTTLTERILSSHSEISSAGELNDFANVLKVATGVRGRRVVNAELIEAAGTADIDAAGRAYLDRVSRAMGIAGRFIDKLPDNVLLAPLILRALPQSRMICLRRHPADVVLGNYRQAFESSAADIAYAFDLEETARHVVRFEALLRRYREALPPERFLVLDYERLVGDFEAQVRRMLDFCGLPFEEGCIRFEDNAAPVATASAVQVREPINARSIGRWRRYRPALDPALQILVEGGAMDAAELD
jgi:tetratricopeptide (TPR) repeat protein